jgi:DnaJ-class molecular chaperone
MSYKFTVKKSIKCKTCKGNGFFIFDNKNTKDIDLEYYCLECDGKGKLWKKIDIPLSSLKELLK